MKKKFKGAIIIFGVLALIIFGVYSRNKPMEIDVVKVDYSDGGVYFFEKGIVGPSEEKLVYSEVNGVIKNILVEENDIVKKGDTLVEIDNSEMEFQIKSLQASISGYEAQKENVDVENDKYITSLQNSKIDLQNQQDILKTTENQGELGKKSKEEIQKVMTAQALVQYENAVNNFEKNKILFENGIISLKEYEEIENFMINSKDEYDKAKLQLETIETTGTDYSEDYYQATYNSLQNQINGIDKQISQSTTSSTKKYYDTLIDNANISISQLLDAKNKYTITSPYNGKITSIEIDTTNMITTAKPAFIINETEVDVISSYVSTRDIKSVYVDEEVEIIFKNRGGDISLKGVVTKIEEEAVMKVSPLGVEERAVLVEIVPEKNDILNKGYEVDIKYQLINGENSIVVPVNATYKKDGVDMVMVVVDGIIKEKEVSIGHDLISGVVIKSGLEVGEVVVSDVTTKNLKIDSKVKEVY